MSYPLFESPLERIIREAREKKEKEERNRLISSILAAGSLSRPLGDTLLSSGLAQPKRNVFISYHHGDDAEVKVFVKKWADTEKVFTAKGLGFRFSDDIIDSNDPEYVMAQIRKRYLQDSSVTIILLGSCTHSRRYVDWEIKSSLRQSKDSLPNGVFGIVLPSLGRSAHFPPRLEENCTEGHVNCYARCYVAPQTATQLRSWIEDAFNSRTLRAKLIKNSSDMMKYNAVCNVCGITH
jgi:hypothetical protein